MKLINQGHCRKEQDAAEAISKLFVILHFVKLKRIPEQKAGSQNYGCTSNKTRESSPGVKQVYPNT